MDIVLERTRIIFSDYTDTEKKYIEDLVATMDKNFLYEDIDNQKIYLPTGMIPSVKKVFPKHQVEDRSSTHWDYTHITPIKHSAEPRNQLQIDFIKFIIEQSKKKQKLAGILSPGTGKALPNSTNIPTPDGYKLMGDIKVGDYIFDENGNTTKVIGVFPQGKLDVYNIKFSEQSDFLDDNSVIFRNSRCSLDHLWKVSIWNDNGIIDYDIIYTTEQIIHQISIGNIITVTSHGGSPLNHQEYCDYLKIEAIENLNYIEEMTCIKVDNPSELFLTEDYIVTHNTFMACYAAIQVGLKTLIIAPTTNVKNQWAETLIEMFSVPDEKVMNVSSPKDFINSKADFVITSQASLAVLNKTYDLEKVMQLNKFGIKVIDEVQMWFHNIIKVDGSSNICHNWYLTGTFGRSGEEENGLFQQMFGDLAIFREKEKTPTIFNRKPGNIYGMKPHMNVKMVWTNSGLSPEEVKKVTSSMRYSERAGKWMRYGISIPAYTELVIPSDGKMTKFLGKVLETIKIANKEVTYGKMLVLSPTIASVEVLAEYIRKMYPTLKIGTIHSRNIKQENDRVKSECDIMISTVKSSGTGFDVKDLSKLVVAEQFKSWILADQVSGRLRRRPDEKDTHMWDIVDSDIAQLRAWANVRADILKKKSKSFKVIDL